MFRQWRNIALAILFTTITSVSHAQDAIFADDFALVTSGSDSVDFTRFAPYVDRYNSIFFDEDNPGSATLVNGRARLLAVSADGNFSDTELTPLQITDYIEAVLTLSSESDISDGIIDGRLEARWFNNQQEGGLDGSTGDVIASLELRVDQWYASCALLS